jgi:hypothetical protein
MRGINKANLIFYHIVINDCVRLLNCTPCRAEGVPYDLQGNAQLLHVKTFAHHNAIEMFFFGGWVASVSS